MLHVQCNCSNMMKKFLLTLKIVKEERIKQLSWNRNRDGRVEIAKYLEEGRNSLFSVFILVLSSKHI